MKWPVIALFVISLVAALAATLLVGALRADQGNKSNLRLNLNPEVTFVVAAQNLPAYSVITASSLTTQKLAKDRAPAKGIADPAPVIGKVLAVPLIAGQALTLTDLVPEGSGAQLAAILPKGKRAVAISLSDYAGLDGILYPGCMVDVLASFKDFRGATTQSPLSITLLEGVQVLGVERLTLITAEKGGAAKDAAAESHAVNNRARQVTLLVDPEQNKALQLAQDMGTLSLALRNPADVIRLDSLPLRFADLAENKALQSALTRVTLPTPALVAASPAAPVQVAATPPVKAREWQTTVIKGTTVETCHFPFPASITSAREDQ